MALTTWRGPGAISSIPSAPYDDVGWSIGNASFIANDDEVTGGITLNAPGQYSHILRCYSFSFANDIPSGSTIDGVLFRSNMFVPAGGNYLRTSFIQLCYNSAAIGTQKGVNVLIASPTNNLISYGTNIDLWGYGSNMTHTVVRDPSFGVQLAINCVTPQTLMIDSIQLQVDYEPPQGGGGGGGQTGRFTNHLRQQKGSISGFIGGR